MSKQIHPLNVIIARKLRSLRKSRHISAGMVAEVLNLSESQVYKIESGNSGISAVQLMMLCRLYEVSASQISQLLPAPEIKYLATETDSPTYAKLVNIHEQLEAEIDELNDEVKIQLLNFLKALNGH